jgi:hypothetical protein
MKYGAVYERRGKLIIHPDGKTTAGVLIGIEPFLVIDKAATSASQIGASLRKVLTQSRANLRHPNPNEWDSVAAPLYAAAGVKSWGVFVRGALLTNVEADGTTIRLLPHENRGARDGFQPRELPPIEVPENAPDEEIGAAILNALELARDREPHRAGNA